MAAMDYKGTLPYASELFGIYQPLLGWKSKLIERRVSQARAETIRALANLALKFQPDVTVAVEPNKPHDGLERPLKITVDNLGSFTFPVVQKSIAAQIDSGVARTLAKELPPLPPEDWSQFVSDDHVNKALEHVRKVLGEPELLDDNPELGNYIRRFLPRRRVSQERLQASIEAMIEREAIQAGFLTFLAKASPESLKALFYREPGIDFNQAIHFDDPLLNFGQNAYEAILAPVGIVHLFREYFFEFDSFLGPAVGHTWLSPGGTVELIEINTRRTLTERSLEMMTETSTRSESQTTNQDDIADAVKEENRNDTKFGFTNEANYSAAVFSDTATASFSLDNVKAQTRETAHKHMRQQSEKLTSEIRKNFKTTFKTSTEVTDTSSSRYVLQNTTNKLANYELRRKMRKVGVQVQDIGTRLCWNAFVDDAGGTLGIARLVHIAAPADLGDLPQPEAPVMPQITSQELNMPIPFVGIDTGDLDIAFTDGAETEVGVFESEENIVADFPQVVRFNLPHYTLQGVTLDVQGFDALLSVRDFDAEPGSSSGSFNVHLDYVNWRGVSTIPVKATLVWEPGAQATEAVNAQYLLRMASYNEERARRFKESFLNAARERITAASTIRPRPSEELREEERTVVFRRLVRQLMSVGGESEHVISELVRSIFDVDKMLYFVAPEWWAPKLHDSSQHLGHQRAAMIQRTADRPSSSVTNRGFPPVGEEYELPTDLENAQVLPGQGTFMAGTRIPSDSIVDWGGGREANRDNYYITEDSAPAKLGSSLGWLLQLDGDNMRNAILNSPWVKAVVPIRLGREHQAINWLRQAHVEGSEGLDAEYAAAPGDPQDIISTPQNPVTIADALDFLIAQVQEFDTNASTPLVGDPNNEQDASNHFAGSLPTEAVFEHGFYPLQGGTRFDESGTIASIVSQWTEILPTDQIVALEVEYDPKTLQIKAPE